jgi:hypothetical protein
MLEAALAHIKASWKKLRAVEPLDYSFMDESLLRKCTKQKDKLGTLLLIFTVWPFLYRKYGPLCPGRFSVAETTGEGNWY